MIINCLDGSSYFYIIATGGIDNVTLPQIKCNDSDFYHDKFDAVYGCVQFK